jgi:hypothetical protein
MRERNERFAGKRPTDYASTRDEPRAQSKRLHVDTWSRGIQSFVPSAQRRSWSANEYVQVLRTSFHDVFVS